MAFGAMCSGNGFCILFSYEFSFQYLTISQAQKRIREVIDNSVAGSKFLMKVEALIIQSSLIWNTCTEVNSELTA